MKTACSLSRWALAVMLTTVPGGLATSPPPDGGKDGRVVVEARVRVYVRGFSDYFELCLADPDTVRTVIEDPIGNATPVTNPARYIPIGSISIKRKDGSEERFGLFHPWGKVRSNEKFITADLSGLQKKIAENAAEMMNLVGAGAAAGDGQPRRAPPPSDRRP